MESTVRDLNVLYVTVKVSDVYYPFTDKETYSAVPKDTVRTAL